MSSRLAWTLGSRLLLVALSAAFGILSARLLGPADKGEYTLLTLLPAAVSTLALLGGPQLALIDTRHDATSRRLRQLAIVVACAASGLAVGAGILAHLALRLDLGLALLASSGAVALTAAEFHAAVVQGQERFRALAVFRVAQAAVPGVPMLLGAALGGVSAAVIGFTLGTWLVGVWAFVLFRKCRFEGEARLPWGYLLSTSLSIVLLFLAYRLDVLMLGWLSTPEQVGYFAIATTAAELLLLPALALAVVRGPRAARGEFHGDRRDVVILVALSLGAGALAAALAGPLVELVFGAAFLAAVPAFVALIPGAVVLGVYRYLASLEMARAHRHGVVYSAAIIVIADLALLAALAPVWGALGAAIASSAAYGLGLVALVVHRALRARSRIRDDAVAEASPASPAE